MPAVQRRGDYFIAHPAIPQAFALGIVMIIFLIVSWVVVGLRFLARWRIRSFGRDDWFMLGAQFFYTAVIAFSMVNHILVPGAQTTGDRNYMLFIYMYMSSVVAYAFGMICLKLSLGYFFLRLLITTEQRYTVYAIVALACAVNVLMIFLDIFFCGNPKDMPNRVYYGGCLATNSNLSLNYFQASINALSDVAFAFLPFWLLHKSLMPKRVRLYVYGILGLASFGCVASIVRFVYVVGLFTKVNYAESVVNLAIISIVELGSGIMSSSLATLKPLLSSLQSASGTKNSTATIGSSGKPGKLNDLSANTGYSQSVTAVGTMASDSIDLAAGKLSNLSNHAKPWASVDAPPASSKSRRLFGIEIGGRNASSDSVYGNASNDIFELPGSIVTGHRSRTHDFALALPDPDAPSEEGEEYALDLDKISPGIPSPALLLPAAAAPPVSRGVPATPSRFALPPLRLPAAANKRLPPTPHSPVDSEQARAELDRRRSVSDVASSAGDGGAASSAPPSPSQYDDDEEEAEESKHNRSASRTSAHYLSSSPALSDYDVVVDERSAELGTTLDDAADEVAESATIHRRRGDNHMTFLADDSDEEASARRKSQGGVAATAVELQNLEPAARPKGRERTGTFDRWRT